MTNEDVNSLIALLTEWIEDEFGFDLTMMDVCFHNNLSEMIYNKLSPFIIQEHDHS